MFVYEIPTVFTMTDNTVKLRLAYITKLLLTFFLINAELDFTEYAHFIFTLDFLEQLLYTTFNGFTKHLQQSSHLHCIRYLKIHMLLTQSMLDIIKL